MAKENLGDIVVDKLHERAKLVRTKLRERYKRTKPLRMEAKRVKEVGEWQME